jgi:hypothetical protein
MHALWCLLVPILSMFLVGVPLRGLLARSKRLDEGGWCQAPFVGLAATVLILQFELHLDIRIRDGVWGLWAVAALWWMVWLWQGHVRESFRSFPVLPFAVCGVVLAVEAAGLITLGANEYVGRSWLDQFNYTTMAAWFRDHGFALTAEEIGQRPWLTRVLGLREYRIGQSVLQAYHSVVTKTDARLQFMPTILLACPLIALALYVTGLMMGLRRRHAALAGLFGGLVPGVTMLAQECFLSHALGIPWLLLMPALLTGYLVQRDGGSLGTAALGVGAVSAIYPEFLPFTLILVVLFAALGLAQRPRHLGHVLGFGALLAAPWVLNPLQDNLLFYLSPHYLTKTGLEHIYPWAYHHDGLAVLWLGDSWLNAGDQESMRIGLRLGRAVVAGGTLGLLALAGGGWVRWWRGGRKVQGATWGLPLALCGLAVIPGLMLLGDHDRPYQFYKVLISVSPLYALGTVALGTIVAGALGRCLGCGAWARLSTGVVWLPVLAAVTLAGLSSYGLVMQSTGPEQYTRPDLAFRMLQGTALDDDFRELRQELESLRGQKVLMRAWGRSPSYTQLWSSYFGRFNQLWLADPSYIEEFNFRVNLLGISDLTRLPPDCLVFSPRHAMFLQPPASLPATAIVWQGAGHTLWKLQGQPWACITDIDRPIAPDPGCGWWMWLSDAETTFHLFATEAGILDVTVVLEAGPCIDPSDKLRLLLKDARGVVSVVERPPGRLVLPIFVERGASTVTVKALNPKRHTLGFDPRSLLIGLHVHKLDFRPSANRTDMCPPPVGN